MHPVTSENQFHSTIGCTPQQEFYTEIKYVNSSIRQRTLMWKILSLLTVIPKLKEPLFIYVEGKDYNVRCQKLLPVSPCKIFFHVYMLQAIRVKQHQHCSTETISSIKPSRNIVSTQLMQNIHSIQATKPPHQFRTALEQLWHKHKHNPTRDIPLPFRIINSTRRAPRSERFNSVGKSY